LTINFLTIRGKKNFGQVCRFAFFYPDPAFSKKSDPDSRAFNAAFTQKIPKTPFLHL